jgi:hypothetical protein
LGPERYLRAFTDRSSRATIGAREAFEPHAVDVKGEPVTTQRVGRATVTVGAVLAAFAAVMLLVPVPMQVVVALLSLPLGASLFATGAGRG